MRKSALLSLALLFLLVGCARYRLERNLGPEYREFLSKVRYIITSQERKTFLKLPSSERKAFIEEFWKKRDPTPDTEENEYKNEYFSRIEDANRLFSDAGGNGWLEDRGRVYILLGPPEQRITYPRGKTFYGPPEEIWYYGFYPIVFMDEHWDGSYELTPLGARHIALIQQASMDLKPKISREKVVFDFTLSIKKIASKEALIQVEVPYENIWFNSEGGFWKTTLKLSLEVFDSFQKKVWDYEKDYPLSFAEKDVDEITKDAFSAEIPITLESGKYTVQVTLINETDKSQARKSLALELGDNLARDAQ